MPRRKPSHQFDPQPISKIVVPVRSTAWLCGDLGRTIEVALKRALHRNDASLTRLPRGFLVEAPEAVGVLLEIVHRAALKLEDDVRAAYPAMHYDMGPVWTGTLQAVFDLAPVTAQRLAVQEGPADGEEVGAGQA